MKKLLALLFALVSTVSVFAFAGCDGDDNSAKQLDKQYVNLTVEEVVFTATDEVLTLDNSTSMKDYMDALASAGQLVFDGENSEYGYYLTSIYGRGSKTVEATMNSYKGFDWAIYTTLSTLDGVNYADTSATYAYGNITLYKSSYGISYLPCVEGETYALIYEYSEMSW